MAPLLATLVLAVAAFVWVLRPLFEEAQAIPQERAAGLLADAVTRSVQELETDLRLQKIEPADLDMIQEHLKRESAS
ncbi:MAG: hypothetical protein ACOYXN_05720 [Acidobacteriota bacterium]